MYQLIIFKDREPILVSDEEYKDGNFVLLPYSFEILKCVNGTTFIEGSKKIIAGIPELPSIDFSALSEEDCKKIGWIDFDKLTTRFTAERDSRGERDGFMFKEGLKTMQALNEKKFSEEDVLNAIGVALGLWSPTYASFEEGWKEKVFQSLSQTKFDVELETYIIDSGDNGSRELSITNNSVKIINYDKSKHG